MWSDLCSLHYSFLAFLQSGIEAKGRSVPPDPDLPSVDNMLSTHTESPGEHVPSAPPEAPPPASLPSVPPTSVSLHPEPLQPCCGFSSQTSEEPTGGGASPRPPARAPPPRRDGPREDSGPRLPTNRMNQPALEQEETSPKPSSHAGPSPPAVTFDLAVAEGLSESTTGWPEDSTRLGSEGPTPETADNQTPSPDASDLSQSWRDPDVLETEEASQNRPTSSTGVSELQAEPDISRNLMSSAVFLGGVVSLSIVLQEPSTLFFIGLLLVLRRL